MGCGVSRVPPVRLNREAGGPSLRIWRDLSFHRRTKLKGNGAPSGDQKTRGERHLARICRSLPGFAAKRPPRARSLCAPCHLPYDPALKLDSRYRVKFTSTQALGEG